MRVRTTAQLGAAIRGARLDAGWTQAQLAQGAGVSRQWLVAVEKGKPTAEVAPLLRTLAALGLVIDLVHAPIAHGDVDLDDLLGPPRG